MRAEIITAKCDRKECKTMIEVERSLVAPEGWLQVSVEIDGKWDQQSKLEFCSAKCVSLWAKARSSNPVSNGTNGQSPNREDQIKEAIEVLIADQNGRFISRDLQDLTGIGQTSIDRWLNKFLEDNYLIISDPGNRTPSSPRVFSLFEGG